jgi:hypothetical protein
VGGYVGYAKHPSGWIVFFDDEGAFHMYSRRAPDGSTLGESTSLSAEEFEKLIRSA